MKTGQNAVIISQSHQLSFVIHVGISIGLTVGGLSVSGADENYTASKPTVILVVISDLG